MKNLSVSLCFSLLALAPAARADSTPSGPASLLGDWRTGQGSIIRMYACQGDHVCGQLLYSPKGRNADGTLRANAFDPKKPMCGSVIVSGLDRDGATWRGGSVFDVEKGRRASVRVRLRNPEVAEARFYKGITLLGVTEILQRTQEPAPSC